LFGQDIIPYLPEYVKPFAEQLRQLPSGYEKWVYAASLPAEIYQGDVFDQVAFASLDEDGEIIRFEPLGMVISNTCDVQPGQGETLLVAPIFDLEDYREHSELKEEALENHIRALTENKISQLMFLPEGPGLRRSFVDFGKICSISLSFFHADRGQKRLISLSQPGHYFLLVKLAHHFCRPEARDSSRN
jgi:hypothetical protein